MARTAVPVAPAPDAGLFEPAEPFKLVLIGGWRLTQEGRGIHLSPSAQRLLAFIALKDHANRPLAAGTLWPEVTEERAQGSLRTTLWRIWRACPGLLEDDSSVLALSPGTAVDVRQLRTINHSLAAGGTADLYAAWPLLASRSELLPGWYDDWVLLERERFRQMHLHVLEVVTETLLGQNRPGDALEVALAAVNVAPLRESSHRKIIEIHLAEGNAAEALRQFEVCAHLLRTDLGLEPSERLIDLMRPVMKW